MSVSVCWGVYVKMQYLECLCNWWLLFLAPTGALEEGILCVRPSVCDIIQNNSENEF